MVAGAGMFGIFLFVTYYLQLTLGYSPIQTGLAFLPMIVMLVLAAQLGTNIFVPRFGPKVLVPIGMALGATGMVWLTFLDASSAYAANIMPPLMLIGFAMGTIMPASMQTATLGVDRHFAGVASATVNTSQQVGGSIGTALLNTLAATATAEFLVANAPATQEVGVQAALAGYSTAYWWGAAFFAAGAVMSALLFRRRGQGLSLDAHAGRGIRARTRERALGGGRPALRRGDRPPRASGRARSIVSIVAVREMRKCSGRSKIVPGMT